MSIFKTNHIYLTNTQIQILLDIYKTLQEEGTRILSPKSRPQTVSKSTMIDQINWMTRRFHFIKAVRFQGRAGIYHEFDMDIFAELHEALLAGVYEATTAIQVASLTVACYILIKGVPLYWKAFGDVTGDKVLYYPAQIREVGYLDIFADKYRVTDRGHRAVEYWDRVSDILLRKPDQAILADNVVRFKR